MNTLRDAPQTFPTIADAEAWLVDHGYKRNIGQAVWLNEANQRAKVVRTGKYFSLSEK